MEQNNSRFIKTSGTAATPSPRPVTPTTPSTGSATAAVAAARAAASTRPQLSPDLFNKFSNLIYELSGIRFQENKAYFLASKLQERCTALSIDGFNEYWTYLQSPTARPEYGHMLDAITINETFFYRNQPQLESFDKDVLKPLIQKRKQEGKSRIRIWSCASSTGDEAYTIALMIKDKNYDASMKFEIIGSDICHDALEKARIGVYRQYGIRNIPQNLMQRYFKEDPTAKTFILSDEIKQMVKFNEGNLVDKARIRSFGMFDLIFCRNVLIYFDEDSKEKVMWNLRNALYDDGTILMGHSENVYSQRHILKADKDRSHSIAYIKAEEGAVKRG